MSKPDVIIIGAGLAGLCCAKVLQDNGLSFQILEASERVGGRIKTDKVDGFLLDRGFQVFLTGYPEAQAVLDYDHLDLHAFYPGSMIRSGGRSIKVADPFRHPIDGFKSLFADIGSLGDKLQIARLRQKVLEGSVEDIFRRPEKTTREYLQAFGFSEKMIERFFRPFFGGVYLENELTSSSRMFEFIFRMFSLGDTALPAAGMEAIPRQIAAGLPADSIRTGARVTKVSGEKITLATGEMLEGRNIVLATDWPALSAFDNTLPVTASRSASYLYYAAEEAPIAEPILLLNGEGEGVVNNLCVPNLVAPGYAPPGANLISVTILGKPEMSDEALDAQVRLELAGWFGETATQSWKMLRIYHIEHALPNQRLPMTVPEQQAIKTEAGLYICGDYLFNGSIHGAMLSGRHAAELVIADGAA